MGKTKQLLENENRHDKPDHIWDAEYYEWVYYASMPYVQPINTEE